MTRVFLFFGFTVFNFEPLFSIILCQFEIFYKSIFCKFAVTDEEGLQHVNQEMETKAAALFALDRFLFLFFCTF